MKKFLNWWYASNHSLHIPVGFGVLVVILVLASGIFTLPLWQGLLISLVAAFLVGVAIEGKDLQSGNKFDWGDVFATISMPLAAFILYFIAAGIALLLGDTLI
jgi:hypothetical protein